MAMTLRLPPEIEEQLKQVAEMERRSVQQTVLVQVNSTLPAGSRMTPVLTHL